MRVSRGPCLHQAAQMGALCAEGVRLPGRVLVHGYLLDALLDDGSAPRRDVLNVALVEGVDHLRDALRDRPEILPDLLRAQRRVASGFRVWESCVIYSQEYVNLQLQE